MSNFTIEFDEVTRQWVACRAGETEGKSFRFYRDALAYVGIDLKE